MHVLLVRPPRYVWPFNSETSAFWQPLGFLALAGMVRRELPDVRVSIIDCPAEKIGWRSLQARMRRETPDVLGIGEETVSAHEGLRLAAMARSTWPGARIVAGGHYYANALPETFANGTVDAVVRGEGEVTLVEWMRTLRDGGDWSSVAGLAFVRDGEIVETPARPPVADLDDLPVPAYDLAPMELYGRRSRNHPGLTAIEHGRGCVDRCGFCTLWSHMGRPAGGNGKVAPLYRTKSPERAFAEVGRLRRDHDRYTFGWVDPTFNADPRFTDEFCGLLLRRGPRVRHTAWVRADGVIRDHESGVLEKMVRAGFCQLMMGIERPDATELAALDKHNNDPEITRRAAAILKRHYPRVCTIGTMIFGLWDETEQSLRRLIDYRDELDLDYCFLMPLTPNPGTHARAEAVARGLPITSDLRRYNFHTPVMPTRRFTPAQLESVYARLLIRCSRRRIERVARNLFARSDPRKRRVYRSLALRGTAIALRSLARRVLRPGSPEAALHARKPRWYDS